MIFTKKNTKQTPKICLVAVRQNPRALQYVRNQTPEICLTAIKSNKIDHYTLGIVRVQTSEICLEAVREDGCSLQFVNKQTPEICLEAFEANRNCVVYVKIF